MTKHNLLEGTQNGSIGDYQGSPGRFGAFGAAIDQICVHPDFRRRGIARALVQQIKQIARDLGATGIQLSIWAFNDVSQAFFKSEGFETIQSRYYQDL